VKPFSRYWKTEVPDVEKGSRQIVSGVGAMQLIFHWVLGISGELPSALFGITYTPR